MLKGKLIHPEILKALGAAGHGAKILIADGNYPFSTQANPAAERVFLNLTPGIVKVPKVLEILTEVIEIEKAEVMTPGSGEEPPIFHEFHQLLKGLKLHKLDRFEFYQKARAPELALIIAAAEQRTYANILLTIGVVEPD